MECGTDLLVDPQAPIFKYFSLTSVRYEEGDALGKFLSLVTLSPIYIVVMYASLVVFNRDLQVLTMSVGQLLNLGLNQILKKIINQPRPPGADKEDSGMPSDHSQFLFFFAAYFSFCMTNRLSGSAVGQSFFAFAVHLLALGTAYSRVYLGYHTVSQVVVGGGIGSVVGILWSIAVKKVFSGFISRIPAGPLGQLLLLKDYTAIQDVPLYEYKKFCESAKTF
mmetsp:Transcript_10175/g.13346  ORF Transcript_10175/g.13346 Transcript_10175/m.13346 type:complete len:222 (-) Transcript_10175:140-805(-)